MSANDAAIDGHARTRRVGTLAALGALLGVVLSGPLAVVLVEATHPQPPWIDAATYAAHLHAVQLLPYAGGILLVSALVVLVTSLHALGAAEHPVRTVAALVATAVFTSFIFFNYVAQTTFVPELARRDPIAGASLIAALSMANPTSLAWAIEMWGWAFFGAASWLVAPVFGRRGLGRAAALAFVANGPVSLAGAVATVARPGWVLTSAGLAAFAAWNALLAAMAVLAMLALRPDRHASATPSSRAASGAR